MLHVDHHNINTAEIIERKAEEAEEVADGDEAVAEMHMAEEQPMGTLLQVAMQVHNKYINRQHVVEPGEEKVITAADTVQAEVVKTIR